MKKLVLICVGLLLVAISVNALDSTESGIKPALKDSSKVITFVNHGYRLAHDDPDSAMYYLNRAMHLSDSISYHFEMTRILNMMGNILSRLGEVDSAMKMYEMNLPLFKDQGDADGLIMTYNNIGLLYRQIGNYNKALEYFLAGIKDSELYNENRFLSNLYVNLGLVYADLSDNDKALIYFRKAIGACELQSSSHSLPYIYNAIGGVFSDEGEIDSALIYFTRGLAVAREYEYTHPMIFISRSIGELYLKQGNYDNAYNYLRRSAEHAESVKNNEEIMKSYNSLSRYYRWVGMYNESIDYSKKTLDLARDAQYLNGISLSAFHLYRNYSLLHQYDSALKYHELYHLMSDSLLNEEKMQSIMELTLQYEYENEQREKEIIRQAEMKRQKLIKNFFIIGFILTVALLIFMFRINRIKRRNNQILRAKNSLIEEQKSSLEELNLTKDRLFGIISHDLRGPFNSMVGFSTVILQRFKDTLDPKVEKYISVINQSSITLYDLVDRLLHWSKIKQNKIDVQKEQINIRESVEKTLGVLNISAVKKDIHFINQVNDKVVLDADPNMLSFVIRNLVSNAIKFTDRYGNIYIKGHSRNNKITISVQDEGIGMTDDELKKLFREDIYHSTKGTDGEKGSGLGLIVCKEFVELMDGTISVESTPEEGSKFTIIFNTSGA